MKKIRKLQNIFETYDIHKSIVVCPFRKIDHIYRLLIKHDFPVSFVKDTPSFNADLTRILLIDEIDALHFHILKDNLNIENINMIIYTYKNIHTIDSLIHIPTFFL